LRDKGRILEGDQRGGLDVLVHVGVREGICIGAAEYVSLDSKEHHSRDLDMAKKSHRKPPLHKPGEENAELDFLIDTFLLYYLRARYKWYYECRWI